MTARKPTPKLSRTQLVALSWIAVVVMAGIIFWISSNSGESVNHEMGVISKTKEALATGAKAISGKDVDVSPVGHFTEYLIFGALLFNALRLHLGTKRALPLVLAVAIASAYGVTDERHQYFVPDRSCDPADWAVDTVAALCGAALARFGLKKLDARSE